MATRVTDDYLWVVAVSSKLLGPANENDLQPYFFNFADGTDRSLLGEDLKLLDGLQGCNISVIQEGVNPCKAFKYLVFDTVVHGKPV